MSKTACYVRVSTNDQERGLESQEQALKRYLRGHGIKNAIWYRDRISGAKDRRPAFDKLQKAIFAGEVKTVVVWKLDRLSRSLKHGINLLTSWLESDVRIISVAQQLDFTGAIGQLIASVLFAVAQLENENLRENTKRGLQAAMAAGRMPGKRPGKWTLEVMPLKEQGLTPSEIAKRLGRSRQAVHNILNGVSPIWTPTKPKN